MRWYSKKSSMLLVISLSLCGMFVWTGCSTMRQMQEASVVPVSTTIEPDMFPEDWRSAPTSAYGTPLESSEVSRSLRIANKALKKYPSALLKQNLKHVYFVKTLGFSGIEAAGTNSADNIYIANEGESAGYTDNYVETTIHHELSSIFLRNYPDYFPTAKWMEINPPGFQYGSGGVEEVKNQRDSQEMAETYLEQGFLHQFSQASMEKDLNAFAEHLFVPEADFWAQASEYPKIKLKAKLAIGFYHHLDPMFTEGYFKRQH